MPKSCLNCGAPAPKGAPANWRFCKSPSCQSVRKATAARDRAGHIRNNICAICHQPFELLPNSKPGRKICYAEGCQREQRSQAGRKSIEVNVGKITEVKCLKCARLFNTTLVERGIPRFRTCPQCREMAREEYSFAEAWG